MKDRTHPAEYYRPEYDLKPDHGTVRQLHLKKALNSISRNAESYVYCGLEWHGSISHIDG
jgi:hypothetical protein